MARTMFSMGFAQNPFYMSGPWLGQTANFDSFTPDKKKQTLQDEMDGAYSLHGKVLDRINKTYGGLGDKLKAYLGASYDNFVTAYYGMMALSDRASKIGDRANSDDPAVLAALNSSDEQVISQWVAAIQQLQQMLDNPGVSPSAPAAGPAGPVAAAPAAPSAAAPAAASGGLSTEAMALGAAGLLGIGVLIHSLV